MSSPRHEVLTYFSKADVALTMQSTCLTSPQVRLKRRRKRGQVPRPFGRRWIGWRTPRTSKKRTRELDQAGRFIRQNFGCRLAFQGGTYRQDCPVALAHNRIGMSIGAIVNKASCSICRRDPHDCSHITGRIYDGNRCVRIIEEAELLEVSLVDRPSMPDARIMSITILDSELKEQLGPNFQPGVPLSCNRCLSDCEGVEDRRPYQARST